MVGASRRLRGALRLIRKQSGQLVGSVRARKRSIRSVISNGKRHAVSYYTKSD